MYTVYIGGFDLDFLVTHHAPAVPAIIRADPLDSHPPEPAEIEWEPATGDERLDYFINEFAPDSLLEMIEEQLFDAVAESHE